MYRVGVIGTGIVGSAVALLLRQKGYSITGVCSKTGRSASALAERIGCQWAADPTDILAAANLVFLTVSDRELENISARLAGSGFVREGHTFLHMSGALPAEVLSPLRDKGAAIGSVHPLQSFASVDKAIESLPGSFFAVQGDDRACTMALEIVADLGGKPFAMRSEDKALYHMGACVASNYLVSLLHFAVNIYKNIGMTSGEAVEALMPLVRGTLSNIEALGPVKSLTGPVARGDSGTIRRHLEAAQELEPELRDLYQTLGLYTVGVALEKGSIDRAVAEVLQSVFREGDDH